MKKTNVNVCDVWSPVLRIVLTNDDGIYSPGLWTLAEALSDVGKVSVVAPDRDSSGAGTGMTLLNVVRIHDFPSPVSGVDAHCVQGTPVDCVVLSTEALFTGPIDLLVSGINPGANMGMDVTASGTVGAAFQGFLRGISSMAVSVSYKDNVRFDAAAIAAKSAALYLRKTPPPYPVLLNINLPDLAPAGIRQVDVTRLGPREYMAMVEKGKVGRRTHYWIKHVKPAGDKAAPGTDIWAVSQGHGSLTSISFATRRPLPHNMLAEMAEEMEQAMHSI